MKKSEKTEITYMPDTVQKYLVQIVQGTIAAAAVINEFLAVLAAKKGFELAGEIPVSHANNFVHDKF